jgi:protein-disulfide isomerase
VVEPASAAPVTDWTRVVTVEGDYFVLGNPAAPVRLVDFSNFF